MTSTVEYHNPIKYSSINVADYDALLLAGGHAPGMKQFLPSLNSGSDLDEPYQRALQLFQPKHLREDNSPVSGAAHHAASVLFPRGVGIAL